MTFYEEMPGFFIVIMILYHKQPLLCYRHVCLMDKSAAFAASAGARANATGLSSFLQAFPLASITDTKQERLYPFSFGILPNTTLESYLLKNWFTGRPAYDAVFISSLSNSAQVGPAPLSTREGTSTLRYLNIIHLPFFTFLLPSCPFTALAHSFLFSVTLCRFVLCQLFVLNKWCCGYGSGNGHGYIGCNYHAHPDSSHLTNGLLPAYLMTVRTLTNGVLLRYMTLTLPYNHHAILPESGAVWVSPLLSC